MKGHLIDRVMSRVASFIAGIYILASYLSIQENNAGNAVINTWICIVWWLISWYLFSPTGEKKECQ